jgi:membrane protease YdiL (CAAX protease family)
VEAGWWRRWVYRDGRLRAIWRVLLFVALFLAIAQAELFFLPFLVQAPAPDDRISAALVGQSVVLLSAALLAGWAMLRWVDRRPRDGLGFPLGPRVPVQLGLGLLLGSAAIALVVLPLAALGAYDYDPRPGTLTGWLAVSGVSLAALALPAAAEEAVFRGYLLRTIREGVGPVAAVGVTSLLFALVHGANPNVGVPGLVNIFLAGALLAVAVLRTGSLWFASAIHLGWNWVMAGPLDLPVSGLGGYDVPLYDVVGGGPPWLTGGAFGPEGGAVGTLSVAVGLGLVLWTTRPGGPLAGAPGRRDRRV